MELAMIKINFTEKGINELRQLQNNPHPFIRSKALALMLKSQDLPHYKIANIIGVSENTLRSYLKSYHDGGTEALTALNFYKPQSQLKSFENQVKEYFDKTPPATISQACADIAKLTGVALKNTQMRKFLKSIGVSRRKVNSIPAKADFDAQQKFHDEKLQPTLQEAAAGKRVVYFADAAHFVMGAFLGYLWSFTRIFVKTPCGRQRFNVLGALNAITKELITITNNTYITSTQVCELLNKLANSTKLPITLILDNVPYQRCQLVFSIAAQLNIELLFLPPYSPNLNLIERVWKLVKKECLYSKYYDSFSIFSATITTFLLTMHQTHKEKSNSLLTLNFQLYKKEEQIKLAA